VDTKLAEIGAVVRDGHGRVIAGLTRENFQIHDNGKPREIADFAVDLAAVSRPAAETKPSAAEGNQKSDAAPNSDAARPRFIALYFDDVNAKDQQHSNDLKQTQDAAEQFVKEALQPGVQVGVFTASGARTLDFTTDIAKLTDAIRNVRPHMGLSEAGLTWCPSTITPYMAYLIALHHDPADVNEALSETPSRVCRPSREEVVAQAEETWRRVRRFRRMRWNL
jgi:VWFA-related protein